jgi:ADP-ribose pyrophosphatase YjhB (NUDIX family)
MARGLFIVVCSAFVILLAAYQLWAMEQPRTGPVGSGTIHPSIYIAVYCALFSGMVSLALGTIRIVQSRRPGGDYLKGEKIMQLKWLEWAKQIQAIGQNGLAYSKDPYDLERFGQLRDLSVEIMNAYTDVEEEKIRALFANEEGYATPKVDVRGVVFRDDAILMVREKIDGAWSLPGGWADIGLSPKEIAVKEVKEESGFDVRAVRLLGVLDKKFHAHPPSPHHVYKIFVLCEIVGGEAQEGMETLDVGFFEDDRLPELSLERITEAQIRELFRYLREPDRPPMLD